jgi:hypothetical protein
LLTAARLRTSPIARGRATKIATTARTSAGTSGTSRAISEITTPKRINERSMVISVVVSP